MESKDALPLKDPPRPEPRDPQKFPKSERLPPAPEFAGGPDARAPIGGGYGPGSTPPSSFGDQLHLSHYLKVLYKRRVIAASAFLITVGIVTVYTFTATPIFQARAQLLIENEEANVVSFKEVVEENRATNDYYQTQYRILQSRALARRTLDAGKLWQHPVLVGTGQVGVTGTVRGWLQSLSPGDAEPPAASETAEQSRTIDAYLRLLTVSPIRNSRLVDITFATPDAKVSADLANAHARAYIDQNLEFKFLASKEAADWLSQRLGEQRAQVEGSEQALQQYREQTGAVALEDRQNIVVQRLADFNAAVTRARTERIEKESAYNQVRSVSADRSAADTIPAILNNTFIQQLKGQLSELQRQQAQMSEKLAERHPDMVKVRSAIENAESRIQAEIQKVVQALRNDYLAAAANERSLQAALEQQRNEAQELNRASIQYGALQRDADSNREIFQGLLQRTRETDIASDLKTNNIRVVDQAEVPRTPASPNKRNNLLFGVLTGLVFAIGLAFGLDYMDAHIKSPEEIRAHLNLAYLGMIPVLAGKDKVKGDPVINAPVPHVFSEAIRTLRTNVLFASADEGCRTILVTSTGPGEGKTIVAVNLAVAIAQAGQRVLIMDCDMRRPRVHSVFRNGQEPGLSNVMVGNAKAAAAVRRTLTKNLWTLAAGKIPPNPAELLASRRFADFLASLHEHFDWIIVDSPPVMAVTDATIIANQVTGVLFVVGSEMTNRNAARTALDQLDGAHAKYVGAVLNRVELTRHAYYYSQYHRREYSGYYSKTG